MQRQETWVYYRKETKDFEGNGDHLPPSSPYNAAEPQPCCLFNYISCSSAPVLSNHFHSQFTKHFNVSGISHI